MANFVPLKKYMFYCLDQMIYRHKLSSPFLDIGCGSGDLSEFLAKKGWQGKAADYSESAVAIAQNRLQPYSAVTVTGESLLSIEGSYKTIFLWDILEHLEDDQAALKKVADLLDGSGHMVIAVPSNPREWRWDDVYYGHHRRYTAETIADTLQAAGFRVVEIWDFTYPTFWLLRRLYLFFKHPPADLQHLSKEGRTSLSATRNSWDIPFLSSILNHTSIFWRPIYALQFRFFRKAVKAGHEMMVLAERS